MKAEYYREWGVLTIICGHKLFSAAVHRWISSMKYLWPLKYRNKSAYLNYLFICTVIWVYKRFKKIEWWCNNLNFPLVIYYYGWADMNSLSKQLSSSTSYSTDSLPTLQSQQLSYLFFLTRTGQISNTPKSLKQLGHHRKKLNRRVRQISLKCLNTWGSNFNFLTRQKL